MALPRTLADLVGVRTRPQWLRCSFPHDGTAGCMLDGATVSLAWKEAGDPEVNVPYAARRGMAFDRFGRLYRCDPDSRSVEVTLFRARKSVGFEPPREPRQLPGMDEGPQRPVALAADGADHLLLIGEGEATVHVYDLWRESFVRTIALPRQPLDILAAPDGTVLVLLDDPNGWVRLSVCDPPLPLSWPQGLAGVTRLAVLRNGDFYALVDGGTPAARVVGLGRPRRDIAVGAGVDAPDARELTGCRDAEGDKLVAGRQPGRSLLRFTVHPDGLAADQPLDGQYYDGAGMAVLDGDVVFFGRVGGTPLGPTVAAPARRSYEPRGQVLLFGLDSGRPANRWGRVFLEACMPEGTGIAVELRTTDDLDEGDPIEREPPLNAALTPLAGPGLTRLPAANIVADRASWHPTGLVPTDDPAAAGGFRIYEGGVLDNPGRYLWVRVALSGGKRTPRIRRILAERTGHDWLKHLPRAFARRTASDESFLQAFLTPAAGQLAAARSLADERNALFDPVLAPTPALAWLAATVGLPLEAQWPETVARRMIAEANQLFARRGTVGGLRRMLEILTGGDVIIVEAFRTRAAGTVGGPQPTSGAPGAALGMGFRLGGSVDPSGPGASGTAQDDAVAASAHRFSVILRSSLGPDQLAAVRQLLERHRPAHTLVEICTVDSGMRAGLGAHVGLTAFVGPTSGLDAAIVGDSVIGRGTIIARGGLAGSTAQGDCP